VGNEDQERLLLQTEQQGFTSRLVAQAVAELDPRERYVVSPRSVGTRELHASERASWKREPNASCAPVSRR